MEHNEPLFYPNFSDEDEKQDLKQYNTVSTFEDEPFTFDFDPNLFEIVDDSSTMASSSTLASREDHIAPVLPQAESRELVGSTAKEDNMVIMASHMQKDEQEDIPINLYQSDIDKFEAFLKSGLVEFIDQL
ncbi:hypothetical protein WOLCODRAFT_158742 [Wolfiporia cocos MD-104 SS10]|uniref:Uncharacterized protein n=1 Tax=Wolfiporia cocos (strain MD-104) TaxID=742152 RepID=A0A2H3JBB6_WOLCO|nr:hypothetical protein WOLCODRAFT_158742 [Wolfiporia cocos MD-104 SS10]